MAYDEYLADRVRGVLKDENTNFAELSMMGGLCFTVDGKMLCGIHIDKKLKESLLMARIGESAYETEVTKAVCLPMDFTGRPMRGYVFVKSEGFDFEDDLKYWIRLCLAFNPEAKASKKKK
tara:strand:+ start:61545 stop:61907 length:363 start_codon:yes stop_codon:yes gene_type:complete